MTLSRYAITTTFEMRWSVDILQSLLLDSFANFHKNTIFAFKMIMRNSFVELLIDSRIYLELKYGSDYTQEIP